MIRLIGVLLVALAVASWATAATGAPSASWGGRWRLDARQSPSFFDGPTFTLRQRGPKLVGAVSWQFRAERGFGGGSCATGHGGTIAATVKGRKAKGTLVYPAREGHQRATATLEATLSANGGRIEGRGLFNTSECGSGIGYSFAATRLPG